MFVDFMSSIYIVGQQKSTIHDGKIFLSCDNKWPEDVYKLSWYKLSNIIVHILRSQFI